MVIMIVTDRYRYEAANGSAGYMEEVRQHSPESTGKSDTHSDLLLKCHLQSTDQPYRNG
jgi:hypothetical protein